MPAISVFYGIVIRMYYREHPPPHIHVEYGDAAATIAVGDGEVLRGQLPPRAARMVRSWIRQHHDELLDNWRRAEQQMPLLQVEPLR